jgi:hypothetical protein
MELFGNKKEPKEPKKYTCILCDFICSKYSGYTRHEMTSKHQNMVIRNKMEIKKSETSQNQFVCDICYKGFMTKSGLWKHNKKCEKMSINKTENQETDTFTPNMFMEMMKQNNEFKDLLVEQNKQIIELSSKPTTTNNFNLQLFLNETCKDALNINDFVKNLQITEKDVDETYKIGYVNGITKIFITALEKLEINQRPVHCSDTKRESVYIRHDNKWEKENYLNIKLTYAIGHIVKLLRNTDTQRNELLEKQGIRTNLCIEPRIDVSEVTKPIGMEYTTPKESCKNYERIARNIMRETNIPK